eukprot:gene9647-biopygen1257
MHSLPALAAITLAARRSRFTPLHSHCTARLRPPRPPLCELKGLRPHLVHFTVACVEERLPIPTASVRYYGKDGTKSDASFAVAIGFEREHDGDEHGDAKPFDAAQHQCGAAGIRR